MAHQNLLRDLLREDQEPFQFHNYISDKHCSKLCKPIFYETSSLNLTLCTKSCFKPSFFHSPRRSPCKSATLFLNIPAKTAGVLLEAATKIHKHSTPVVNIGFCSFFKRLRDKNKARKCSHKLQVNSEDARLSSAGWSDSNKGKSLDLESSSSTSTYDYTQHVDIHSCENECSSSQPFRFALQWSSSADHTPEFLSPVRSPISQDKQQNHHEEELLEGIQVLKEDKEEKDQFSPVSVLAPPFVDDHEQHRGDDEDEEDSDDSDVEGSYTNVQRARVELLNKLRRFERLAELDPVELEKRMLEDYEDEDEKVIGKDEDCNYVNSSESLHMEVNLDMVVREVLSRSNQYDENKIPLDIRRLLLELIAEERKSGPDCSSEVMVSRVCKRLDAWKEVQSNTIDMMVELDLRKDVDDWKLYKEEVQDKARELELAIFRLLLEEIVSL
ncbi:Histone-lysine N-methyltransferase SETD1B-like [Heracleum sosnowskyi]|uniref:Histone-lysine N-methyltransferase SETD1B-like n=1 Tax=Heracleum sosnowskyi TaxID=360622 RepID=A0AAD8HYP8_9APIA|nr:Histone-lysine N-methyltransferase SETD1B-like [Heracleum sosnowskyi]